MNNYQSSMKQYLWTTSFFLVVSLLFVSSGFTQSTTQSPVAPRATQNTTGAAVTRKPQRQNRQSEKRANKKNAVEQTEFDEKRAFGYMKKVCDIGPRVSASKGMWKQQEFIKKHFTELGGAVYFQHFKVRNPANNSQATLANTIVRFQPERTKRVLICCHYDTRPFPDQDPTNPRGTFIGANDGGSGVGLLCELGNHMKSLEGKFGVDLVFFDGEEFVYVHRRDPMFLGSTFFSQQYAAGKFKGRYRYGVLVDMVADKNLEIHYEGNSLGYAPRLTRHLWSVAGELGVTEFKKTERHKIRDDHLPLNQIAKIPTCDIIDFDFPVTGNSYWHTEKDIVENCSAESLGKVGRVVLEWLRQTSNHK